MWKDFCSFRSSINDESLLKILDQRLTQHRTELRAKKEANERKKLAKQEAEKKKKEKEEKEKRELKSMEQLMRWENIRHCWRNVCFGKQFRTDKCIQYNNGALV